MFNFTRAEFREALKESVSDTALAFVMNVPIGFGIIAFAKPLYGVVFFTGFLILIAYTSLSYQAIEQRFFKSR